MCLELVLSILCLLNPSIEVVIDRVELAPHVIGTLSKARVDHATQLLGRFPLSLRSCDIILSESHP